MDNMPFGCFVAGVIGTIVICMMGLAMAINYADYVSSSAQIESLRADMSDVVTASSEDVVGQATAWNQKIASWRRWNTIPFACLFAPNGWDDVEYLDIPKE